MGCGNRGNLQQMLGETHILTYIYQIFLFLSHDRYRNPEDSAMALLLNEFN